MDNFTSEDIRNIVVLISKAPITGNESITVALLLQKLNTILNTVAKETPKEEEK